MPPKAKLGAPAKGKWKSASSYFVLKPAKTEAEETVERTKVEERKRFAKEARERTVAVLASLGIAAAAEPRSAGRPTSQQLWEDGIRGYVAQVEGGTAKKPREYATTVPKDWQAKATTCVWDVGQWHRTNRASHGLSALKALRDAVMSQPQGLGHQRDVQSLPPGAQRSGLG